VITPAVRAENCHVFHLYVIRLAGRDKLQAFLKDRGIFTGIHYPIPIHLQNAMAFLGYRQGDLPVTEQVSSQILSLPMYAELTVDEIKYVVETIREFQG
jgi:dTDP-4-amino-4,6-dideoxygalactose transaminase